MREFPSQIVSDIEKLSYEYGLKVAKAIEHEWFDKDNYSSRYIYNRQNFHNLRLYARGEQTIQKYKDELSINGDLSYLNLDWKPVPIIPKFVDIVVNGMANRMYDIKAYSQDPNGVGKRTQYMNAILEDMRNKDLKNFVKDKFGLDLFNNPPNLLPETQEELDLHMQLTYKQAVEMAEEQAINTLLESSRYELIKKRFYYDLTVLGIGAVKTSFNNSDGAKVEYVDPANLIYSYTESPYFDDIYYVGEIKSIPINELAKEFPHLTLEDLEEATKYNNQNSGRYNTASNRNKNSDNNKVQVLYFNYKTFMNEVYKVKETATGGEKAIVKDDSFNPPKNVENFNKQSRSVECLYDGALILGTEKLVKWEMSKNMMRSKSNFTKVRMNYSICAPRMYEGRIESLVSRITGFADMIQLTHLKIQQVMSRITPDGVYLDADGLAEIDLGNGTNYNPQEALNMFFQTGSIIGRSLTSEGDMNPGKVPIQEIQNNNGGAKLQSLIGNYNYYLQMIRDTTGLNEARDAAQPDPKALVGVQKMAAANSNTATRHILQGGLFLTKEIAECLSLRISDIIEYSPTSDAFIQALGYHNVATLSEMSELYLYDFGIFIELSPDEEEKAMLENNIQVALAQQNIELEDAIDLREIKNIKLANQLLKIRRRKKLQRDQEIQQQNMQAQAQANIQQQQAAAQAEMQKQQMMTQTSMALDQNKNNLEIQKLQTEAQIKKQLMELEFQFNMQLKGIEVDGQKEKERVKEDRKDERTKIQATQQSELIEQRQQELPSKNFESSGNDILDGIDLSMFGPR
jgi:RNase P/RNase MRP subunit p29